jgi:hypothetical protein
MTMLSALLTSVLPDFLKSLVKEVPIPNETDPLFQATL